jgi:sulfur carrier protein
MNVYVNGEPTQIEERACVADVVASLTGSARGVAVAVDLSVVPRSEWSSTRLHEGARVEVLVAAAGG